MLWPPLTGAAILLITSYFAASFPPIVFAVGSVGIAAAMMALMSVPIYLSNKRWKSAVSCLMLPGMVIGGLAYPQFFIHPLVSLGDHVRLFLNGPWYEAQISSLKEPAGSRHYIFDWGGFIAWDVYLIYDETDQLAYPPEQRRSEDKVFDQLIKDCGTRVNRVRGHYYRCDI